MPPHNGKDDALRWHLVLSHQAGPVGYTTLSHCWGSHQPLSLTRANFSSFSSESAVERLPKTYQDALVVTLSLGYRYIWIDSLCIIQDDRDDWLEQAPSDGSNVR